MNIRKYIHKPLNLGVAKFNHFNFGDKVTAFI